MRVECTDALGLRTGQSITNGFHTRACLCHSLSRIETQFSFRALHPQHIQRQLVIRCKASNPNNFTFPYHIVLRHRKPFHAQGEPALFLPAKYSRGNALPPHPPAHHRLHNIETS